MFLHDDNIDSHIIKLKTELHLNTEKEICSRHRPYRTDCLSWVCSFRVCVNIRTSNFDCVNTIYDHFNTFLHSDMNSSSTAIHIQIVYLFVSFASNFRPSWLFWLPHWQSSQPDRSNNQIRPVNEVIGFVDDKTIFVYTLIIGTHCRKCVFIFAIEWKKSH